MTKAKSANLQSKKPHRILSEIMRRRRSVRQFERGRKVTRDTLLSVAESARWAPTGANSQCWDLIFSGIRLIFLRAEQYLSGIQRKMSVCAIGDH